MRIRAELFSRRYREAADPSEDSELFRSRLAAMLCSWGEESQRAFASSLRATTGYEIRWNGGYLIDSFFEQSPIDQVLDTITCIIWFVSRDDEDRVIKQAERFNKILREERLAYRIESSGSVVRFVDEQESTDRSATVALLGSHRLASARQSFIDAQRDLLGTAPRYSLAIYGIFRTAETIARLIDPEIHGLKAQSVDGRLKPLAVAHLANGDAADKRAIEKFTAGFGNWIGAAHEYRHAQGQESPREPAAALAVAMLTSGYSYIRFLAELDNVIQRARSQI